MINVQRLVLTLPFLTFACGGLEQDLADESIEESVETTEDALVTVLDHCAAGENPNARIDPRYAGGNVYERSAASVNSSSCRDTTIVDFNVNSNHIYEFFTTTTFPTATDINKCHDSYIHMRLLRKSGSSWVEEDSIMVGAEWRFDFSLPNLGWCAGSRADARNWLPIGTQYRVRARAYRHDGTYSKVIIGVTS